MAPVDSWAARSAQQGEMPKGWADSQVGTGGSCPARQDTMLSSVLCGHNSSFDGPDGTTLQEFCKSSTHDAACNLRIGTNGIPRLA